VLTVAAEIDISSADHLRDQLLELDGQLRQLLQRHTSLVVAEQQPCHIGDAIRKLGGNGYHSRPRLPPARDSYGAPQPAGTLVGVRLDAPARRGLPPACRAGADRRWISGRRSSSLVPPQTPCTWRDSRA